MGIASIFCLLASSRRTLRLGFDLLYSHGVRYSRRPFPTNMAKGSLLATEYPDASQWREIVRTFAPEAVAHKLLLAHTPFIFKDEPLKFALFRRTIADAFGVAPTDVFIVGSAMSGRSLKGKDIETTFSSESDIDTLIISEHLFASYVMRSFEWVREVTRSQESSGPYKAPKLDDETVGYIGRLSMNACKGIWRPDSLPQRAIVREEFFERFGAVSLKVLGLQLSEDTVSKVTGRIARSFNDAVTDLASSIHRLRREFEEIDGKQNESKKGK